MERRHFFDDEEENASRICGQQVFNKLRRSRGGLSFSTRSKTCLQPVNLSAFTQSNKSILLPDTDSTSAGTTEEGSDFPLDEHHHFKTVDNVDSFIQFDPSELEFTTTHDEVEVAHALGKKKTGSSLHQGSLSLSWSQTLPSVAEEDSYDEEEQDNITTANDNEIRKKDENQEKIMQRMRELLLKQQRAVKELAEENQKYRQELLEKEQRITRLESQQEEYVATIKELEKEKNELVTRTTQLKNEFQSILLDDQGKNGVESFDDLQVSSSESMSPKILHREQNAKEIAAFQPYHSRSASSYGFDHVWSNEEPRMDDYRVQPNTRRQEATKAQVQSFRTRLERIQKKRNRLSGLVSRGVAQFEAKHN